MHSRHYPCSQQTQPHSSAFISSSSSSSLLMLFFPPFFLMFFLLFFLLLFLASFSTLSLHDTADSHLHTNSSYLSLPLLLDYCWLSMNQKYHRIETPLYPLLYPFQPVPPPLFPSLRVYSASINSQLHFYREKSSSQKVILIQGLISKLKAR